MEHSILARLPPELRNYVFSLVLGGHFIYLRCGSTHGGRRGWCNASTGPQAFKDGRPVPNFFPRHIECISSSHPNLNLALLQTCRQVYSEARLIPLAENIFSFYHFNSFPKFMESIPVQNRVFIKSVHLSVTEKLLIHVDNGRPDVLCRLEGLRIVYISLTSRLDRKYPWSRFEGLHDRWLALVLSLRALHLQDAYVEVTSNQGSSQADVWSSGEKEQWASRTRLELLNQVDIDASPDDERWLSGRSGEGLG